MSNDVKRTLTQTAPCTPGPHLQARSQRSGVVRILQLLEVRSQRRSRKALGHIMALCHEKRRVDVHLKMSEAMLAKAEFTRCKGHSKFSAQIVFNQRSEYPTVCTMRLSRRNSMPSSLPIAKARGNFSSSRNLAFGGFRLWSNMSKNSSQVAKTIGMFLKFHDFALLRHRALNV